MNGWQEGEAKNKTRNNWKHYTKKEYSVRDSSSNKNAISIFRALK